MATRAERSEAAYRTIKEIACDLEPSDEYYFKACVEEYFRMKGLNLQASRGDCTGRYWNGCNEGAMIHNAHLECRGMSRIEAMEEYVRVALSLKGDTAFGDMCYEEISGEPVMNDLGLEESDSEEE
ncbi:hypothetical protein ACHAWF_017885 [Thalassiosira exigua]